MLRKSEAVLFSIPQDICWSAAISLFERLKCYFFYFSGTDNIYVGSLLFVKLVPEGSIS